MSSWHLHVGPDASSGSWRALVGTSRRLAHGLAEEVAREVEQGEALFVQWSGILRGLDGNLDDLFTGVHFDPNRGVAEIDLVTSAVLATDYRMGHVVSLSFRGSGLSAPPLELVICIPFAGLLCRGDRGSIIEQQHRDRLGKAVREDRQFPDGFVGLQEAPDALGQGDGMVPSSVLGLRSKGGCGTIRNRALSEQIGLSRGMVFRSLRGCKIPSVISTVRPR